LYLSEKCIKVMRLGGLRFFVEGTEPLLWQFNRSDKLEVHPE